MDERGESLAEVVCAVAIIGVAVVGLVGALGTTFGFARTSRVATQGDVLLVRYAEALAAAPYEPCSAGVTPYQTAAVTAIPSGAESYELEIESVAYWNADTNPASFATSCGAGDDGAQVLHLRARSGDGAFDRRLTITKRAS